MFLRFLRRAVGEAPAVEGTRQRPPAGKWDVHFKEWIERSQSAGLDPNDIGDQAWGNDFLDRALDTRYLPYIKKEDTVLELGPGTGRLTRHLIGRCRRIEIVDNSAFVIDWMGKFLEGKCEYGLHHVKNEHIPGMASGSVGAVVAHGVFEHLDFDETANFLDEFKRVLRPGGYVSYNYNTLHNDEGFAWFRTHLKGPGRRCIFRFYTPDFMERLAKFSGFDVVEHDTANGRLCHIVMQSKAA